MDKQMYMFFGHMQRSIYRDEKTGKGTFLVETKQYPVEPSNITTVSVKCDAYTGQNITWYSIMCNAFGCPMPSFEKDTPIRITGYFDRTEFGPEFKVLAIALASDGEIATIRYLEHFVSRQDAVKFVQYYGYNIFSFIEQENAASLFQQVTSLTAAEAVDVIKNIRKTVAERHLFDFLSPLNIPFPYCLKAIKIYGQYAETYLRQNPFLAGSRIGLAFKQCQAIANKSGMPPVDEERIRAAAVETMRQISMNGDTYAKASAFRRKFESIAGKGLLDKQASLTQAFPYLSNEMMIMRNERDVEVHSIALYEAERRIARNLERIGNGIETRKFQPELIRYAENVCHMQLGNQQRKAFQSSWSGKGIKVIVGGPGTGKTSFIKGFILTYLRKFPTHKVTLCAPTGRAAQKMAESTGFKASTIHKTIRFIPYSKNGAFFNASNPLDTNLLIVDESSMLDVTLTDMLLEAVKTGTTVVFMGDSDQLEAVGPGAILYDILHVQRPDIFTVSVLTEVFRQKNGSTITENAKKIRHNDTSLITADDFHIIRTHNAEESLAVIKQLVVKYHVPSEPFNVQILAPANKGVAGVQNLNKELQAILNPGMQNGKKSKELVYGNTRFRVNDKIMMIRNNYGTTSYYNGDIGIVKSVGDGFVRVEIQGQELDITRSMLDEMVLSYAMTVHKSQGSDFPVVIVSLPKEPENMLIRNLFYTAITRAKKQVFVVAEGDSIETSIQCTNEGQRQTQLQKFLTEKKETVS